MELARKVSWVPAGARSVFMPLVKASNKFAPFGSHEEHLAGETVAAGVVLYAFFGFR